LNVAQGESGNGLGADPFLVDGVREQGSPVHGFQLVGVQTESVEQRLPLLVDALRGQERPVRGQRRVPILLILLNRRVGYRGNGLIAVRIRNPSLIRLKGAFTYQPRNVG